LRSPQPEAFQLKNERLKIVPTGTRSVQIQMVATRGSGSDNDGSADNLNFSLSCSGSNCPSSTTSPPVSSGSIKPSIFANNQKEITVSATSPVSLTLSLDTGGSTSPADWWIVYAAGNDIYWLGSDGEFSKDIRPVLKGIPLQPFSAIEISNGTLVPGDNVFCFAVDTTPDGQLNNPLYYDCAAIHVTSGGSTSGGSTSGGGTSGGSTSGGTSSGGTSSGGSCTNFSIQDMIGTWQVTMSGYSRKPNSCTVDTTQKFSMDCTYTYSSTTVSGSCTSGGYTFAIPTTSLNINDINCGKTSGSGDSCNPTITSEQTSSSPMTTKTVSTLNGVQEMTITSTKR
ncbi:MAG: hypothetical protein WCP10_14110, partial [Desulfuromonadales bacterium]